jgi:membrane-bound lytic murein transglycosylase C
MLSLLSFATWSSDRVTELDGLIDRIIAVSNEWHVEPELSLAIAHTESHFKSDAVSHAGAYGVMQIVSRTAGRDIARLLIGQQTDIPIEYLLNPEKNIALGVAYLNFLQAHYFKYISNSETRRYMTISAYNGGVGTVTKLFKLREKGAKAKFNQLDPKTVFETLLVEHPYEETRNYLQKVNNKYQDYKVIFSKH